MTHQQVRLLQTFPPVATFSTVGFLGMKGTGKSTQMQYLANQYIEVLPYVSHYFYIARDIEDPTLDSLPKDCLRLQWSPAVKRPRSEGGEIPDTIEQVCQEILEINKKNREMIQLQEEKIKVIYVYKDQYGKRYEVVKWEQKYKEMLDVYKMENPSMIYRGKIRSPNIILVVDDLGVSDMFQNPRGALYQLMINQRHESVQLFCYALHSYMNINKKLRETQTQYVLFDGQDKKRLQTIFDELRLEKSYFNFNQFFNLYKNYIEPEEGSKQMSHNFLFIMSSPIQDIFVVNNFGEDGEWIRQKIGQ